MDWVHAMVEEIGGEEMKEVGKLRKLQKYFVLAYKLSDDLIHETVGEEVGDIALTAVIEDDREKQEKIKISRERLQKKLTRKVFKE